MPIRLNLLAEAQAAEELRRRDPVKRAIWISVLLVMLVLVWSSTLQLKKIIASSNLNELQARVASQTNEYQSVIENERMRTDVAYKLTSLHRLATNRFLYGNFLNALQQTGVEGVQLMRLDVEQKYIYTEGTKPKTNGARISLGRPATATERIEITLDAKDFGSKPGEQKGPFKDTLTTNAYFAELLGKTNEWKLTKFSQIVSLPPPEPAFQTFTLEARLPDRTR